MRKLLLLLALFVVFTTGCVNGQSSDNGETEARKAQIVENLKFTFPQLRERDVVVTTLENSDIEGVDEGSFVIDGRQQQPFLITDDNAKLYLLAAEAIDASLTAEEIAAKMAEEKEAAAQKARERSRQLEEAVAGLPVRGHPDAPVTIVEFSDFQCPYCARAYTTVEQILEKYPEDVKFVYAHFPLPNHRWAKPAAIAAVCAAQQDADAFWQLHDYFFENQSAVNTSNVVDRSKTVLSDTGIDLATWETCASDQNSEAYQGAASSVEGWVATGQQFGVTGTPGFFVNGHFVSGAQPLETFDALIVESKDAAASPE